jgi:hypothetical protein
MALVLPMQRDYYDAFSIMCFNTEERKKNYYQKNALKIIERFVHNYVLPYIICSQITPMYTYIGWNCNSFCINYRDYPEVKFKIYFNSFKKLTLIVKIPHSRGELKHCYENVPNFISLKKKLEAYLAIPLIKYNSGFTGEIDYDSQFRLNEVVIISRYNKRERIIDRNREYRDFNEVIDSENLYNTNAIDIIRMIFVALDSQFRNIGVYFHPIYN